MQTTHPFIKAAYELIMESEDQTQTYLEDRVEQYVVLMFANNFQRTDIGEQAIAIKMLEASQQKGHQQYIAIADECLLIHSYPLRRNRWPTENYYFSMGTIAYGLAHLEHMEQNFEPASRVLRSVFKNFG